MNKRPPSAATRGGGVQRLRRRLTFLAVIAAATLAACIALIAFSNRPADPLSSSDIVGAWVPAAGTGSLSFHNDKTFEITDLSTDPIYRTPPLGAFYGTGTWTIDDSGNSIRLKFMNSGDTGRPTPSSRLGFLYNMGALRSGDVLTLYFEDASLETRFFLMRPTDSSG